MKLIAPTQENAIALKKRYYKKPALFMEEILSMDLDKWQRELCEEFHQQDRHSVSSGHSSGKSAFTAGIVQYFIALHPDPQIIVTANTQQQLREKTWRELAKWHQKSLIKDWFTWTATRFALNDAEETWFASAVPNTPHNSEAFAGVHEKYILQIFDEASGVDRAIWEVAEGATPTPGGYRKWLAFGNPTRSSGAFFDTHHSKRHRWSCRTLDTRGCKYADQKQIKEWAEDYGEESDFFKIRVKGQFPSQSANQLIGRETVDKASDRSIAQEVYEGLPVVLGVDVARFGDDQSVICKRQGLKCHWLKKYRKLRTTELAGYVAEIIEGDKPDAVFIDSGAMGAGVIDRLVQLGHEEIVFEVGFGEKASDDKLYHNKRSEIWCKAGKWLEKGDIPNDSELVDDLVSPLYGFDEKQRYQLEKKKDTKKRGLASPDCGDSLALTFSENVMKPRIKVDVNKILTAGGGSWMR